MSSSPIVLHRDRACRAGAFILAANHLSPFDVPCLMKETPRVLDFVSIVEVFRNPWVAWFYGRMGAFPLDRSRIDVLTTRTILDRLRRGRVVAMFPEGRIRTPRESVLCGGGLKRGVLRLAQLAGVPIVPCVIVGSGGYERIRGWLPVGRTIYGVNYGQALEPTSVSGDTDALENKLRENFQSLYQELKRKTGLRID